MVPTSATRGTNPGPHVAPHTWDDGGKWQVDYVRASENTYAFRLRWAVGRKRTNTQYVSRVTLTTFKRIKQGDYDAFKNQLIAIHGSGALSASQKIS